MKIEKGRPGYIRFRKTKYLLWAVIEFAVVIALVVIGIVQSGSRMNLLTGSLSEHCVGQVQRN